MDAENIEANGNGLSDLKHYIDKMDKFKQYFRNDKIREHYEDALKILRDKLFEAIDVDN